MNRLFIFILFPFSVFSNNPQTKDEFLGNFDLGMIYIKNNENTFQFNNLFLLKYQKKKSFIIKIISH